MEQVFVEESQKVKKGDVLVQLDEMELESTIQALRATLRAQQNDLAVSKKYLCAQCEDLWGGRLPKRNWISQR